MNNTRETFLRCGICRVLTPLPPDQQDPGRLLVLYVGSEHLFRYDHVCADCCGRVREAALGKVMSLSNGWDGRVRDEDVPLPAAIEGGGK